MSQLEGSQGGLDALAAAVRDTQQQDAAGSPVAGAPHDALAQQKLGLQRLEACSRDLPEEEQVLMKGIGAQIPDSLVFSQQFDKDGMGPAISAYLGSSLQLVLCNAPPTHPSASQQGLGAQQPAAAPAEPMPPQLIRSLLTALCSSQNNQILPISSLRICGSVPSNSSSAPPAELAAEALEDAFAASVWQLSAQDIRCLTKAASRGPFSRLEHLQLSGISSLSSDSLFDLVACGGLQQKLKYLNLAGSPGIKRGQMLQFSDCIEDMCNKLRVLTVLDLKHTGMSESDLDLLATCLTRSTSHTNRAGQRVPGAGASLQALRVGPLCLDPQAGVPAGADAAGGDNGGARQTHLAPLTITALAGLPQLQLFQLVRGDVQPLREALATTRPQEVFAVVEDTVTCVPGLATVHPVEVEALAPPQASPTTTVTSAQSTYGQGQVTVHCQLPSRTPACYARVPIINAASTYGAHSYLGFSGVGFSSGLDTAMGGGLEDDGQGASMGGLSGSGLQQGPRRVHQPAGRGLQQQQLHHRRVNAGHNDNFDLGRDGALGAEAEDGAISISSDSDDGQGGGGPGQQRKRRQTGGVRRSSHGQRGGGGGSQRNRGGSGQHGAPGAAVGHLRQSHLHGPALPHNHARAMARGGGSAGHPGMPHRLGERGEAGGRGMQRKRRGSRRGGGGGSSKRRAGGEGALVDRIPVGREDACDDVSQEYEEEEEDDGDSDNPDRDFVVDDDDDVDEGVEAPEPGGSQNPVNELRELEDWYFDPVLHQEPAGRHFGKAEGRRVAKKKHQLALEALRRRRAGANGEQEMGHKEEEGGSEGRQEGDPGRSPGPSSDDDTRGDDAQRSGPSLGRRASSAAPTSAHHHRGRSHKRSSQKDASHGSAGRQHSDDSGKEGAGGADALQPRAAGHIQAEGDGSGSEGGGHRHHGEGRQSGRGARSAEQAEALELRQGGFAWDPKNGIAPAKGLFAPPDLEHHGRGMRRRNTDMFEGRKQAERFPFPPAGDPGGSNWESSEPDSPPLAPRAGIPAKRGTRSLTHSPAAIAGAAAADAATHTSAGGSQLQEPAGRGAGRSLTSETAFEVAAGTKQQQQQQPTDPGPSCNSTGSGNAHQHQRLQQEQPVSVPAAAVGGDGRTSTQVGGSRGQAVEPPSRPALQAEAGPSNLPGTDNQHPAQPEHQEHQPVQASSGAIADGAQHVGSSPDAVQGAQGREGSGSLGACWVWEGQGRESTQAPVPGSIHGPAHRAEPGAGSGAGAGEAIDPSNAAPHCDQMLDDFRQGGWQGTGDPKQNIAIFKLLLARQDLTEAERRELAKRLREQKRLLEFPGVTGAEANTEKFRAREGQRRQVQKPQRFAEELAEEENRKRRQRRQQGAWQAEENDEELQKALRLSKLQHQAETRRRRASQVSLSQSSDSSSSDGEETSDGEGGGKEQDPSESGGGTSPDSGAGPSRPAARRGSSVQLPHSRGRAGRQQQRAGSVARPRAVSTGRKQRSRGGAGTSHRGQLGTRVSEGDDSEVLLSVSDDDTDSSEEAGEEVRGGGVAREQDGHQQQRLLDSANAGEEGLGFGEAAGGEQHQPKMGPSMQPQQQQVQQQRRQEETADEDDEDEVVVLRRPAHRRRVILDGSEPQEPEI